MDKRSGSGLVMIVLLGGIAGGAAPANAQYPISKDAFTCQDRTSRALSSFLRAKQRCITGCERRARQGKNPFSDCVPPFAGETAECVASKAVATADRQILVGCTKECPSCYAGGDCATGGTDRVDAVEGLLDSLLPGIYCATDGDANVNACRERVVDEIGRAYKKITKCYRDCYAAAQKGDVPDSDCVAPFPSDSGTASCIAGAVTHAVEGIDRGCYRPRSATPPCYDGTSAPDNSVDWALLAQLVAEQAVPSTFCGP